jgi:FSR family fosmidomycin resistance protein-like MFS transporter
VARSIRLPRPSSPRPSLLVVGGEALDTYNFTGDLGKVVVPAAIASAAVAFGWQYGSGAYGVLLIAAAAVVFILLRWLGAGSPPPIQSENHEDGPVQGWGIIDRRGFTALASIGMIDSGARLGFLTFLPFLLLEKGAEIETLGVALGLVFAGGAAGKLVCGHIAHRVGILRTVVSTEIATIASIAVVILSPLPGTLAVLPFLGIALNGTSSVLYGTVGDFLSSHRQARAYGLFYTLGIGAGALSPVVLGVVSDHWSVTAALSILACSIFAVLPLCSILRASIKD